MGDAHFFLFGKELYHPVVKFLGFFIFKSVEVFIDNATMLDKQHLINSILGKNSGYEVAGTLAEEMKEEWWVIARKKFSLEQLESLLGTKFDLM